MSSIDSRFLVLDDGRFAVCEGFFITHEDASCICTPPEERFRRFCPCQQEGCHTPRPTFFISNLHPLGNCNIVFIEGDEWCYTAQPDTYTRLELDLLFPVGEIIIIEAHMPVEGQCVVGCNDPLCVPEGDTCNCGEPCGNVCWELWRASPEAPVVFCCKGEFDAQGRPTHDWSSSNYYRLESIWTDGCGSGCFAIAPGSPRTCILDEFTEATTGNEERTTDCNIRKEVIRHWLHRRNNQTSYECGNDQGEHSWDPVWVDEPPIPIPEGDTGWVTDYEDTNCAGCRSFGEHRLRSVGSCNYYQQIYETHNVSCDFLILPGDTCCTQCTLEWYSIQIYEIHKTPGTDREGCCAGCRCQQLGIPDCDYSGGGECLTPNNGESVKGTGDYL